VEGGGGVEAAGEGDADFLADGEGFEDDGHGVVLSKGKSKSVDAKFAK
jgi:hypothetical protein